MNSGCNIHICPGCNIVHERASGLECDIEAVFMHGLKLRSVIYRNFPRYGLTVELCPICRKKHMRDTFSLGDLSPTEQSQINKNTMDCLYIGKVKFHSDGIISFKIFVKGVGVVTEAYRAIIPGLVTDYGKWENREMAASKTRNKCKNKACI